MNSKLARFWVAADLVTAHGDQMGTPVSLDMIENGTGRLNGAPCEYSTGGTYFQDGDVLYGKLRPYLRKFLRADSDGTAIGDIYVFRPTQSVSSRYLYYVVASPEFSKWGTATSTGTKMPRTSWASLREFPIVLPDLATQERIADYLDRETGQIDRMVAKLDEQAALLRERRQVVIERNVSQQGTSRFPQTSIGYLFGRIGSGTTPSDKTAFTTDSGIPWVTTGELRENVILETKKNVKENHVASTAALQIYPKGSVLIAMYGATIGRLGRLGVDATCNQACCVFSEPKGIDLDFFCYALIARKPDLLRLSVGGGQPNISRGTLEKFRIPLPPIDEQRRIAAELDDQTAKIDAMIAKCDELRALLAERRSALITEVVTGRKEV